MVTELNPEVDRTLEQPLIGLGWQMIKVDDDTDAPLVVNPIVLSASDGDWDGRIGFRRGSL